MSGSEGSRLSWLISARLATVFATATFCIPATYALLRNIALSKCAWKLRISDGRLLSQWSGLAALAAASTASTVNTVLIQREDKRAYNDDLVVEYLYRLRDLGAKLKLINRKLDPVLSVVRDTALVSPEENGPTLVTSRIVLGIDIDDFIRRQFRNIVCIEMILHGADWSKFVDDYERVRAPYRHI